MANPMPAHCTMADSPHGASSATPAAARPTHTRSTRRRDAATATPSGPRNSMATAIPMGSRDRAS